MKKFSIKIVGPAGTGIKSTGITLAKIFTRHSLNVFAYTAYPSLIRGGHNTYQVDVSEQEIRSSSSKCDILIALTAGALQKELNNINRGGIVICDEEIKIKKVGIKFIKGPLLKIAKENGGELMKNTVAVGVLMKVLRMELEVMNKIITENFENKKEVAKQNIQSAQDGFDWSKENKFDKLFKIEVVTQKTQINKRLFVTGNQACALGCVAAQCQLYAAYPMTPATDILHVLEAKQRETGMMVHQTEDEISAIHVALGGAFTGARSACGTSGGGFALMNEGLSLTGMLELPLVVFEVQRPGPATGNPTWSEQGDLNYVVHAGHGEYPKIVLTPGTPEQCFDLTQYAFNLADKYQTLVIVLSDKHLGESAFTLTQDVFKQVDKIDRGKLINKNLKTKSEELFARYKITKDGISPRTIPGIVGGEHIANSDEHNEFSYSDESSEVRIAQMDKRMKKVEGIKSEIPLPKIYGPQKADITLIAWGSTFGACLDAINTLNSLKTLKKKYNLIHFDFVWPLPKGLNKFLYKFKKLVLVEQNKTGQLGQLIRQETGIEIKNKILKYDSRPFWKDELVKKIKNVK